MSTGHRLRANIAALSVLQISNYVVPLVTVPYLVRVLRPECYGRLAFAQALIVCFDLISNYGFELSATRAVALCRNEPDALRRRFWLTIAAKIALTALSAVTLTMLVFCIPRLRETPGLYASAFLTVLGTATFPVWFFQGIEEMRSVAVAHSAARILTIPALVLWVRSANDLTIAAAIQGSVSLWAALFVLPVLRRRLPHGFESPSLTQTIGVLTDGWHAFISSAASGLNASATILVLGLVTGNAEVGYYSAADKVIRAVGAMLNPASQAVYPRLNAMKADSPALALAFLRKSLLWITVVSGGASLAVLFLAPVAGPLIWGSGFTPSILVLRCLAPLPVMLALTNGIGSQALFVFGLDYLVSRVALICVSLNVLFTALLGVLFGAVGAALAAVASLACTLVFLGMSLRRHEFMLWRPERAIATPGDASCL